MTRPGSASRTVLFSGHEVPGEGEHKIMQHIREARGRGELGKATAHCTYGNVTDLIMLGLVTHEPPFTQLREVIVPARGEKGGKAVVGGASVKEARARVRRPRGRAPRR